MKQFSYVGFLDQEHRTFNTIHLPWSLAAKEDCAASVSVEKLNL